MFVGSFEELPFSKLAPTRTSATSCETLTARQWASADSISLSARPTAAGGAGPPCDLGAVAKVGLDQVRGAQVDPILGGVVVERNQFLEIAGELRGGLGEFRAGMRRLRQCGQHVADLVGPAALLAGSGKTSRNAPEPQRPVASREYRGRVPRRAQSRSRSAHASVDSRYPPARATSSLRLSARVPIMTSRLSLCASRRMLTWIPSVHRYAKSTSDRLRPANALLGLPLVGRPR
ncbi:hypothetical protein LX90_007633 [Lentzea flava]|nr:hypothetical protein [Lentzea flava]